MGFTARVIVNALAIWLASLLITDRLQIVGSDSTLQTILIVLGVGLIYALVNSIVKPMVTFISIPLYILTLGLFSLVVNALMLMLTAWVTEQTHWGIRLEGGFWWAVWIALVITVLNTLISSVVSRKDRTR
jgi:putative membrane protein